MDRKEGHKMEQGEEMDTKKDQGKKDSSNRGQRTQAKPPPAQPGSQKPQPEYGGGGGAGYWQQLVEGGEGDSSRSS
jgi:hypothetical protein